MMTSDGVEKPPELLAGIRELLNRWDPIDILDAVPDPPADEYDALVAPIAGRLAGQDPRPELIAYLRTEMRGSFGLDPDLLSVEAFVDGLLDWYGDVWLAGQAGGGR